ncbi:MBL fold metallo-hydrolase [Arthrobacter sp. BL-252-APC-1A]|uniref:MBL fold metallo-hydrolase n=1 Tax=Arthrobacter sp. BL-252-APC-1A TaxID=2606622 RepID=UPI0012B2D183|nr:MBL fold metallo-hydrolase [Arthrobacter sp. BL-252-APC-1A]MSR98523.1 MBL fold metallo-hydrolase [Arthrobacter sp. BL-252-APC-1A]
MGNRNSARYALSEPAHDVVFVQGPASNWVILRRGREFTLVDGGYPGDRDLVLASIRGAGLEPAAASAVLVTHAHVDHTGAAAFFARAFGTPVLCSPAELELLHGREKAQVSPAQVLARAWRPRVLAWGAQVLGAGGLGRVAIPDARSWTDAGLAELPGSPVAVPTAGHTPGHTSFLLPAARAVVTGDALVTGHRISGRTGPQLLHTMFHSDGAGADRALLTLARLDASLLLPGHGPALRISIRDAVNTARARSVRGRPRAAVVLPGRGRAGWAGEPGYGRVGTAPELPGPPA